MLHSRALTALASRFWALSPEKLEAVSAFVAARLEGRDTGETWPEVAQAGCGADSLFGESGCDYEIRDGVAVIPVVGVMDRRLNLFSSISGGVSSQQMARRIRQATNDASVEGILLDIDSPGGSVFAVEEISDALAEAVAVKPVVAHSYGLMCSAAYWIASKCSAVVVGANAEVGSIGVAMVHYDMSERDRAAGVRRTVMSAGKYKRIAADNAPLSHEGQQHVQAQLDTYYSLFVDAVATGRGVSAEQVLESMADGRTFIGEQALEAGLVDHIGNLETALALARGERRERMPESKTQTQAPPAPAAGATPLVLTIETLRADHAGLVAAITEEAGAEATQAERARVLEILEAGAGPELTVAAVSEGIPGVEIYKRKAQAEGAAKTKAEAALKASLGTSAGQAGAQKDKPAGGDFMELVRQHQKDNGCTRTKALLAVARAHPAAHEAYIKEVSRG